MFVKTVLVTGANRGIGLEFVRQFLSAPTPPEHLIATYRDPNTSHDLLELAKTESSLHAIQLDVTNSKAFPDLVSQLEKLVGNSGLNLLINNAGFKESELRDLDSVTEELMVKHFKVNCVAPLLLTRWEQANVKTKGFLRNNSFQSSTASPEKCSKLGVEQSYGS